MPAAEDQFDLFGAPPTGLPGGLRYAPDVVSSDEAARLVEAFAGLPFEAFDFHGFKGNRRIVSYGGRYDFSASRLEAAAPIPDFLLTVRAAAAAFAGLEPESIHHAMVTEYAPGAGIGWHRDRPEFDKVIGLSFGAEATMRFRRRSGAGWERASLPLAPRSAYLLDGAARQDWQHSIAPGERLRYSVTFRTLR
jgi:alkylated DNA repair dioxygenase AlkB